MSTQYLHYPPSPPKKKKSIYKVQNYSGPPPKKDKINKQISKFYSPKNQMSQTKKMSRFCHDHVPFKKKKNTCVLSFLQVELD